MKMSMSKVVVASLALFLIGAMLNPALARSFSPEPGVRCKSSARVCYVRGAPSVRMTYFYFGERAAKQVRRDLRRQHEWERYSHRAFYPRRGVRCDRFREVCYDRDGYPSYRLTREYLGWHAARSLRQ